MDIKEFNKYANNLDTYSASDVEDFKVMTDDELEEYQHEVEIYDGGNLSSWDHIRAIITLKKKIKKLEEYKFMYEELCK